HARATGIPAGAAAGGRAGHGQNASAAGHRPIGRAARLVRAGGWMPTPRRPGTPCAAARGDGTHLQTLGLAQMRAALAGCAWLVRLLPELAEVLELLPAVSYPPEQERRLIQAAVARVLTNVAGSAGTLLIL